jgi:putative FmdB family regulatory protein
MIMPIYEYVCDDCKKNFEVFVGVHDGSVQACKYCAGSNIRKLISNCSFQLKGSGWYITDYARKDAASSKGKKPLSGEQPSSFASEGASGSNETATAATDKDTTKPASSEKAA